jgi:DNA helicase II / ATP-dependent DNA helicase PcrA
VRDPTVGPVLAGQFDHVLVDEYQDTDLVQGDILRALGGHGLGITVVGDDAQAIYSFRSATVRNILDFPGQFPGTSIVALEQNYRSTSPILALANAVIAEAGEGYAKQLWTDEPGGVRPTLATCPDQQAQAAAVVQTVLDHYEAGVPLRDQAVLFRTGHHSDLLEVELRRRRIPFVKYGGLRFLEAAHVRDLLAMLRVVQNPWDELAWMRILHLARGAGPASADRILTTLGVREPDRAGPDPLVSFCAAPGACGGAVGATPDLTLLAGALEACRTGSLPAGAQVETVATALDPLVRHRYDHADARLADFDALARLAAESPSAGQFVADLTLDPPASTGDLAGTPSLDDDWLTLSTVHSAKGGEWGVVHLIHAADGAFPSDMATGDAEGVDEERRLFYVALTRARRHLHLYAPLRYHHGDPAGRTDRHSYAQRSRFLPPDVDPLLDLQVVRGPDDVVLPPVTAPLASIVETELGALW